MNGCETVCMLSHATALSSSLLRTGSAMPSDDDGREQSRPDSAHAGSEAPSYAGSYAGFCNLQRDADARGRLWGFMWVSSRIRYKSGGASHSRML